MFKRLVQYIVPILLLVFVFGALDPSSIAQAGGSLINDRTSANFMDLSTPIGTTFIEAEDTDQVTYTGSGWVTNWGNESSGGQYTRSSETRDTASFTFEGVSISIVFLRDYASGIADISIDGIAYPSVDLMNNVAEGSGDTWEVVVTTDLEPGQHVIEVTVTGQKGFSFLWGNDTRVSIDGFRYGNFPFGTIEGRVLDPDGDGIYGSYVEVAEKSNVYTVYTSRDGVFNFSGLTTGYYSVTGFGPDYEKKSISDIQVTEGSNVTGIDITLPETDGHALFHQIYHPRTNSPVIRRTGDTFDINVKESKTAKNWQFSLHTPFNTINLPLIKSSFDEISSWTLTTQIPPNTPIELYSLSVSSTLSRDTEIRSVQVVEAFSANFNFVILGDPQASTNEPGQDTINQIVDEINLINPSFVLIVGDLLEDGTEAEYEAFLQAINRLKVPNYSVPGNHDVGSVGAIKQFPLWKQYIGRRYYGFDYGDYRFIGMDNSLLHTMDPSRIDIGHYFADQVSWVASDLAAHQDSILRFLFLHVTKNVGYDGDSIPEWKPGWLDDLKVNMVFSGHASTERVEIDGNTPIHWVETPDVILERYRLIRVEGDAIESYTYNKSEINSIPSGNLHLEFSPANNGTYDSVTATIDNRLQEHFDRALIRFIMPGGSPYQTDIGNIIQVVDSDDGKQSVVYVSLDVPPVSLTRVTLSKISQYPTGSNTTFIPMALAK